MCNIWVTKYTKTKNKSVCPKHVELFNQFFNNQIWKRQNHVTLPKTLKIYICFKNGFIWVQYFFSVKDQMCNQRCFSDFVCDKRNVNRSLIKYL